MARSSYKTIIHPKNFFRIKVKKSRSNIFNRSQIILKKHLYKVYFIHNGKRFIRKKIVPLMIGHKFGEFSITRKISSNRHFPIHTNNQNKKFIKKK